MTSQRAVVIPFGVPADGRGLGLGLAALVHSFAQVGGENVALAQLLGRREEDEDATALPTDPEPSPVEAFVPPQAWRDLAGSGRPPEEVSFVVTGAFEPPTDGHGLIQLLVFDAKNGSTRARVEAQVDGDTAGSALIAALEEAWRDIGGELGVVRDIGDLSWGALESVLLAERCALHDPMRGGPHDRLAAMVHLGRAVGDAPDARFPAGRLAALALDVAIAGGVDDRLTDAAFRALERATADAPRNADLVEAVAALLLRRGDADGAEARVLSALEIDPGRARLYALLSEARRANGSLPGALSAIEDGLLHSADDPLLNTERGIVLAERGSFAEAAAAWRMVLDARPLYPAAFMNLASMAIERRDAVVAAQLVDDVLASRSAHPSVIRRAIQLTLSAEPDGVARASRLVKLAATFLDRSPPDAWVTLVLGRALAQTGETMAAARRLSQVEELAPDSAFASDAQRARFAIEEPKISAEVEAVLRAAYSVPAEDLETLCTRARGLAASSDAWVAHVATGIVERRLERWARARASFEAALARSPACVAAHMEIVGVCVAMDDAEHALKHARRAVMIEGETARTLAVLATAMLCAGMRDEAKQAIDAALELDASDEANRALAERIRQSNAPRGGPLGRLREVVSRWRKR
jgi:tetratricopeptide (TPR) repeat protein